MEIIEGEVCPDHVHMVVSIPPKMSVSGFMGYLKGKSSLLIFQKFGNLKFAYRNREFWCKGYYVDTMGKDTKAIKEYVANQLKQDKESDQYRDNRQNYIMFRSNGVDFAHQRHGNHAR